jgi:hypothetical protein
VALLPRTPLLVENRGRDAVPTAWRQHTNDKEGSVTTSTGTLAKWDVTVSHPSLMSDAKWDVWGTPSAVFTVNEAPEPDDPSVPAEPDPPEDDDE